MCIGVGASPDGPVLAGPLFPTFFGNGMKFIIDICARAITDRVPYSRAYYSRTTSKVLPTSLMCKHKRLIQVKLKTLILALNKVLISALNKVLISARIRRVCAYIRPFSSYFCYG